MGQTVRDRVEALFSTSPGAAGGAAGEGGPLQLNLYLTPSGADLSQASAAPDAVRAWAAASGFNGDIGAFSLVPGADGKPMAALAGIGTAEPLRRVGALPRIAPARFDPEGPAIAWSLVTLGGPLDPAAAALEWALGAYRFERYKSSERPTPMLADPGPEIGATARETLIETAISVFIGRNLVNTPAADLGPEELEAAVAAQAELHGAAFESVVGDDLLEHDFPMIHAVGRASPRAPRLLDLTWAGPNTAEDAPLLAIIGKGVCFDTGGLNLKPGGSMRLMKKDMGGAAAALALARMVMTLGLPVRLRLLIPAVENSLGGRAFRPGDVLPSRKGLTVEIDNTDAEGRLVLADALTLADADAPDLIIDLATLTGAARVALGAEIAPFYPTDDAFAGQLAAAAEETGDPLWRMPLWDGYETDLASTVADCVNSAKTGFGGSITAALFLRRFVSKTTDWAHFDIYGWNPKTRPGRPEGGEATAVRAIYRALERRYAGAS
ncbi:MAG: leucyl aminopeptidase family protein [Pseudomonadota bacterium]